MPNPNGWRYIKLGIWVWVVLFVLAIIVLLRTPPTQISRIYIFMGILVSSGYVCLLMLDFTRTGYPWYDE